MRKDSRIKILLRKAATSARERYGIGGRLKMQRVPKPITLPKLKCLD